MTLWTPRDLTSAPLQGWWFLKDALGVKADGFYCSQAGAVWTDANGNSADLVQATGPSQPAYGAAGLSTGHPALTFTAGQFMRMASGFNFSSGMWNHIYVGQIATTADTSGPRVLSAAPSGGHDYDPTGMIAMLVSGDDASQAHYYSQQNGSNANIDMTPNVPAMFEITAANSTTYTGRINSTSFGTFTGGTNGAALGQLGLFCEAGGSGANNIAGKCAEIITVSGIMSSTDIDKLEGYAAWNNGVQGSLPGGHAYASAAPTKPDVYGWRRRMYLRR